jgi:hypothetical protein
MSDTVDLVVIEDPSAAAERIAVAGFLAGYTGNTLRSYATDLRLFAVWCREGSLTLFTVRRPHLELFGRWMEENGRMRSTVGRRLSTLASFYRYCEQEQLIDRNPALNVRRPKVDYESRTLGLDRNELGAFLVQAGLGSSRGCGRREAPPTDGPSQAPSDNASRQPGRDRTTSGAIEAGERVITPGQRAAPATKAATT